MQLIGIDTYVRTAPSRPRVAVRLPVALISGASFVLALPPYSILLLGVLSFAALTLLLRGLNAASALIVGLAFGLGQFVPGLFWITESFQVEADRFGWLALPAVLGLAAVLSVFPALACAFAARLVRAGLPPALSLATFWTVGEWLRGHVLTGFPWNLAAYALANWTSLSQGASVVGSYGLGFVLVFGAASIGLAIGGPTGESRQHLGFATATMLALAVSAMFVLLASGLTAAFLIAGVSAWQVLRDVRAVAGCMPGAAITEQVDPTHYKGNVKVKVGPTTAAFAGDIEVREVAEDARRIALLRPDARIANVARGELVDEAALCAALAAGRLRGAYLDTFVEEPLPRESVLWGLSNMWISPHNSAASQGHEDRVIDSFLENFTAWLEEGTQSARV